MKNFTFARHYGGKLQKQKFYFYKKAKCRDEATVEAEAPN